jgi:transcriptional regulator with XRE-family HTH domain
MPRVGNPKNRRPHFVRAWREHRGLTGQQLADLLGTTKANISRIENLRQGYTQDFLEACAKVLRTTPAALIASDPNAFPGSQSARRK